MREVLELTVSIALSIGLPAWVVRRDLARLSGEPLARSWNDASLWSAVVTFGPLCILVHFVRTRRSLRGLALGAGWTAAALATSWLVSTLFS